MLEVDRTPGAKSALVTFGSFTNPGRTEPSYAFVNTVLRMKRTRKIACDAYYFKAKSNDWYFSGIEGCSSFAESCAELSELVSGYDNILFLGNSMGAYAALAFGLSINADMVLAFSPQTRFDADFCNQINEKRWRLEFEAMRLSHDVESMAIRSFWSNRKNTTARVYIGSRCSQDVAYVTDLNGKTGLDVRSFPDSGHDLVHDLRATGQLEQFIFDGMKGI